MKGKITSKIWQGRAEPNSGPQIGGTSQSTFFSQCLVSVWWWSFAGKIS